MYRVYLNALFTSLDATWWSSRVASGLAVGIKFATTRDFRRQKILSLNMFRIVPFQLYASNKHPTQNTAGSLFGLAKPLRKNSEISHRTLRHTSVVSNMAESVQDDCPNGRVVLLTKNTFWRRELAEPIGRFPPPPQKCYASVHCGPTLIFQFSSKSVQVLWELYPKNPSTTPKVIIIWGAIGFFELALCAGRATPPPTIWFFPCRSNV